MKTDDSAYFFPADADVAGRDNLASQISGHTMGK